MVSEFDSVFSSTTKIIFLTKKVLYCCLMALTKRQKELRKYRKFYEESTEKNDTKIIESMSRKYGKSIGSFWRLKKSEGWVNKHLLNPIIVPIAEEIEKEKETVKEVNTDKIVNIVKEEIPIQEVETVEVLSQDLEIVEDKKTIAIVEAIAGLLIQGYRLETLRNYITSKDIIIKKPWSTLDLDYLSAYVHRAQTWIAERLDHNIKYSVSLFFSRMDDLYLLAMQKGQVGNALKVEIAKKQVEREIFGSIDPRKKDRDDINGMTDKQLLQEVLNIQNKINGVNA